MKKLKKKLEKINWSVFLYCFMSLLPIVIVVVYIVLRIIVLCKYGGMPITEVPSWTIPFLTGGGK